MNEISKAIKSRIRIILGFLGIGGTGIKVDKAEKLSCSGYVWPLSLLFILVDKRINIRKF